MSDRHDAGQLIIMGLPGPDLPDGIKKMIERIQPGGFILFTRNLSTPTQTFGLIKELRGLCRENPIITLDQEGGRVSRLKKIGEVPPSGYELCLADREDWCREHGELTGEVMGLLGFNLNLAPVLDYSVDEARDNSLRGRCYGRDPGETIHKAGAFLEGMLGRGVQATGKHFPGYTYCGVDPHGDLPKIDRSGEEIRNEELSVFRHFLKSCASIMIGHGWFPAWHQDSYPASLSKPIITDLLRKEMGYDGLIMTDDLEMGAVANKFRAAEVTRRAIRAGNDALLFCHNPACVELSWEALRAMPEEETAPALASMQQLRKRLLAGPEEFDFQAFTEVNKKIADLRQRVQAAL
jgi:beta-N-acetylhexosaminidase